MAVYLLLIRRIPMSVIAPLACAAATALTWHDAATAEFADDRALAPLTNAVLWSITVLGTAVLGLLTRRTPRS